MKKILLTCAFLASALCAIKLLVPAAASFQFTLSGWGYGVFFGIDIGLFILYLMVVNYFRINEGRPDTPAFTFVRTVLCWLMMGVAGAITLFVVPDKASVTSPLGAWITLAVVGLSLGLGDWLGVKLFDPKPVAGKPEDGNGDEKPTDGDGDEKPKDGNSEAKPESSEKK